MKEVTGVENDGPEIVTTKGAEFRLNQGVGGGGHSAVLRGERWSRSEASIELKSHISFSLTPPRRAHGVPAHNCVREANPEVSA